MTDKQIDQIARFLDKQLVLDEIYTNQVRRLWLVISFLIGWIAGLSLMIVVLWWRLP